MSDKFYVGLDLTGFENNGVQRPVSRVTLRVDEERVLTAGDDSGFELAADCPHATQAMVNSILARVRGFQYQMYEASDINIDPAAELGDGITAGGVYAVIARVDDDGSGFPSASAPGEAELEDEYPSGGPMTQEFNRKIAETRSRITKTAEEIRLEVENEMQGLSASFSVQLGSITSRVQGVEGNVSTLTQTASSLQSQITAANGNISTLTQTASSLQSQITTANGNISSITQTVSSISSSVKNLEGEVSNIQQSANKISLSVTGGLGSTASIILDVNGNKQTEDLDLSNVRQSFANDNSAVTISGGKVTFNSGTFVVNSSNLKVTENGTIAATNGNFSGTITGSTIRGSSLYSETSATSMSITGGRMQLMYGNTLVGYIGTNYWKKDASKKGLVFDMEQDGGFMTWARRGDSSSNYIVKLFYAAKELSSNLESPSGYSGYVADRLYFGCQSHALYPMHFGPADDTKFPYGSIYYSNTAFIIEANSQKKIILGSAGTTCIDLFQNQWKLVQCYNDIDMSKNSILNTSDERLKTNIEPSGADALSIINSIRTYSFDWVENGEHEEMGFIAQQLEAEARADFVSINEHDGHYSTREMKMIPYLVKAVQQLSEAVEELRGETAVRRSAKKEQWVPGSYTLEEKSAYAEALRPNPPVDASREQPPIIIPG